MTWLRLVLCPFIVLIAGVTSACAETNSHLVQRLRPRGHEMRERLARIAEHLPPKGSVTSASAPSSALSPALVLDYRGSDQNADVLMEEHLLDPDAEPDNWLPMERYLLYCLQWTGSRHLWNDGEWDEFHLLSAECERAFASPWLIVLRPVSDRRPAALDLEVFVVDLRSERVVSAFPLSMRASSMRELEARSRPRPGSGVVPDLSSEALAAARCAIAKHLGGLPGARVSLDESGLGFIVGPDACGMAETSLFREVPVAQVAADPASSTPP